MENSEINMEQFANQKSETQSPITNPETQKSGDQEMPHPNIHSFEGDTISFGGMEHEIPAGYDMVIGTHDIFIRKKKS